MTTKINQTSLALVRGDITRERVDAIANAANEDSWAVVASMVPFTALGERPSRRNAVQFAPSRAVVPQVKLL